MKSKHIRHNLYVLYRRTTKKVNVHFILSITSTSIVMNLRGNIISLDQYDLPIGKTDRRASPIVDI